MSPSLHLRILRYALEHRHEPKWKRRLYALLYGAGMIKLARIR